MNDTSGRGVHRGGMLLKLGLLLIVLSVVIGEVFRQVRVRRDVVLRQVPFSPGLSGAEFARLLLRLADCQEVKVIESRHLVTDHYVPGAKILRLAPQNYHGVNLAAVGLAAHEVGHALQEAAAYHPLPWRQTVIGLAYYGSFGSFLVAVLPILVARPLGLLILGACWFFIRANSLLTLPVERDASSRVLALIRKFRALPPGRELAQFEQMLRVAEFDKLSGFLKTFHFLASHLVFWKPR